MKSTSLKDTQNKIWLAVALGLAVALWLLKPILLPFVAGMALAYFLDPVVARLARLRVPRALGAAGVLVGFILALGLLGLMLVPVMRDQALALAAALPDFVASLKARVMPLWGSWMDRLSPQEAASLREAAGSYAGNVAGFAANLVRRVLSEGLALFDILTLLVITPIVAFYLLKDWPKVTNSMDNLLPKGKQTFVRRALAQIDSTLSGFMRGQALVCLALSVFYGVGLTLAGLKYGALIGIVAGVLSFIPYVGSLFCLIAGTILGLIQFDPMWEVWRVWVVFGLGQILEGYVLTPKLVGGRVGLHPVWILFAVFAGGSLLGFVGVLIAVPVAAVIGVLIRLGLEIMRGKNDET